LIGFRVVLVHYGGEWDVFFQRENRWYHREFFSQNKREKSKSSLFILMQQGCNGNKIFWIFGIFMEIFGNVRMENFRDFGVEKAMDDSWITW